MPRRTKGQPFLLTAAARSLSLAKMLGMTEPAAEAMFAAIRWAETKGQPVCPRCGCPACHDRRRPAGVPRWRRKACRADFWLTSLGYLVRLPQAADPRLSRRDRDLRQ